MRPHRNRDSNLRPSSTLRRVRVVGLPLAIALVLTLLGATSASAALNAVPEESWVFDSTVNAIAPTNNGGAFVGGFFTHVGPRTGGLVQISKTDGSVQAGLPEVAGGPIYDIVPDGSGGWYLGGTFTHVGEAPRAGLARVLADGTVDGGFVFDVDGTVHALALEGGALYIAGDFTSVGGVARTDLAAISQATHQLAAFSPTTNGRVSDIEVVGTTMYVAGSFSQVNGTARSMLAAVSTSSASVHPTWNPAADAQVFDILVDGDNLFVAGVFSNVGSQGRQYVAEISTVAPGNATGWQADAAGGPVTALALSGTDLYVGGAFDSIGGVGRERLAIVDATSGAVDGLWNPGADGDVTVLGLDGSVVVVGGRFDTLAGAPQHNLGTVASTGTGAPGLVFPPASHGPRVVDVSTGSIVVGGDFASVGGELRRGLVELGPNGQPTGWNPAPDGFVHALELVDGTLYVGGSFGNIGGGVRARVASFDVATGALTPWAPTPSSAVHALAVDGAIVYLGGSFYDVGGEVRERLAAVDRSSGSVLGWNPPVLDNSSPMGFVDVHGLAVFGDSVYVAGEFNQVGGEPHRGLARFSRADGSKLPGPTLDRDETRRVRVFAGELFVAGRQTMVDGQPRTGAFSLDANHQLTPWNPSTDYAVNDIARFGDGLVLGGAFQSIVGLPRTRLASTDAAGSVLGWHPDVAGNVETVASQGARVYVGGSFRRIGARAQRSFAIFKDPDPPANTALPAIAGEPVVGSNVTCDAGSWSGAPGIGYALAWTRNGAPIDGATSPIYTVVKRDGGRQLGCTVSATNENGSAGADAPPVRAYRPASKLRVGLRPRKVNIDRRWRAPVSVTCPRAAKARCTGVLLIKTKARYSRAEIRELTARKRVVLGKRSYAVKPGKTRRVKVRLNKRARALIRLRPNQAIATVTQARPKRTSAAKRKSARKIIVRKRAPKPATS